MAELEALHSESAVSGQAGRRVPSRSRSCCLQHTGCPAASSLRGPRFLCSQVSGLVRTQLLRSAGARQVTAAQWRLPLLSLGPLDRPFCQGQRVAVTGEKLAATPQSPWEKQMGRS